MPNMNLAWKVAAHVMWLQRTGRESEHFMRDKNRSWQLHRLKQIVTKPLGRPRPQTHSYVFCFSVTQLFVGPLVSCGRWRQINAIWNNGRPKKRCACYFFSKVSQVPVGPSLRLSLWRRRCRWQRGCSSMGGQTTLKHHTANNRTISESMVLLSLFWSVVISWRIKKCVYESLKPQNINTRKLLYGFHHMLV